MSEQFDVASIEAKILSLDATSITVLGWLPYSKSDNDIIRRSGSWNYNQAMIERSLERIYKAFDIDTLPCAESKRQRAVDMYLAFKNAEYPLTAFSRRGRSQTSHSSVENFFRDDKEESYEMDTVDNLDCNRVGTLNNVQLGILKALSEGKDKYEISRDLRISVEQVVDEAPRIFDHLQIEGQLEHRRRTACELYEEYVEQNGEPIGLEVAVTPVNGSSKPTLAVKTNADNHDIDQLASLIAGMSPRVRQVAGHLVEGRDVPAIAKAMGISEASVQPYMSNVYSKLGLHHSLGTAKRLGLLKLAYERFIAPGFEVVVSEKPVEASPPPATDGTVPSEFQGVNIAVVAQKLAKLTPRLRDLAVCLIREKDPLKELGVAPSTLNSYKNSLFSQLGLTNRGLTRKERLRVLGFAYEKAFVPTSSPAVARTEASNEQVVEVPPAPESVRIPEPATEASRPVASPEVARPPVEEEKSSSEVVPHYGQGVPIILSDPETILDVAVVSGRHLEGAFDSEVDRKRQSGFNPEILVVYPTANPSVSFAQLVLIKRKH